jgi:hypothetical protein
MTPPVGAARRAAHALARCAFGATLLVTGSATWLACAAATATLRPPSRARRACRLACKACWTAAVRCMPWVRMGPLPDDATWRAFAAQASSPAAGRNDAAAGAILLINHASPMDPLFFVAAAPRYVLELPLRVLVHARHFRVPLFGGVCRMCGHFPVHFVSRRAEEAATGGESSNSSGRHVVKALQARLCAALHELCLLRAYVQHG